VVYIPESEKENIANIEERPIEAHEFVRVPTMLILNLLEKSVNREINIRIISHIFGELLAIPLKIEEGANIVKSIESENAIPHIKRLNIPYRNKKYRHTYKLN
jgi:hypothetical protein